MKKIIFLLTFLASQVSVAQTYLGFSGGLASSKVSIDEPTETLIGGFTNFNVERVVGTNYGIILSNGFGTNGKVMIQTGFNFLTKGYAVEFEEAVLGGKSIFERDYYFNCYEIPLQLRLVLGKAERGIDPYIIGGLYGSYARKANVEQVLSFFDETTFVTTEVDKFETNHVPYDKDDLLGGILPSGLFISDKIDLGYTFGGGFAFNIGSPKLFIEAKTNRSFNSRSVLVDLEGKNPQKSVRNNSFYISVGV